MRNSGDNFLLNRCYMRNTTCTSNCCPLELDVVSQMGALHYSTLVQMQDHIQESFEKNVHFHYGFHLNPSHDILATILILGNTYTIKSFFLCVSCGYVDS